MCFTIIKTLIEAMMNSMQISLINTLYLLCILWIFNIINSLKHNGIQQMKWYSECVVINKVSHVEWYWYILTTCLNIFSFHYCSTHQMAFTCSVLPVESDSKGVNFAVIQCIHIPKSFKKKCLIAWNSFLACFNLIMAKVIAGSLKLLLHKLSKTWILNVILM